MILPKENAYWLAGQPEHILSSRKVTDIKFAVTYLSPPLRKEVEVGMISAIRRDLTRNLGRTQKTSFDTIRAYTDQLMGVPDNNYDDGNNTFTQLNLVDVIGSIIGAVSNQMLVGDKLFHNDAFMQPLASFGEVFGLASLMIGQFLPFFIRPVIGVAAGFVVKVYKKRALKFLVPAAQERIDELRKKREDPGREFEAPLDVLQWVILACLDASAEEIADIILSLVGFFPPFYVYLISFTSNTVFFSIYFLIFSLFFILQSTLNCSILKKIFWCSILALFRIFFSSFLSLCGKPKKNKKSDYYYPLSDKTGCISHYIGPWRNTYYHQCHHQRLSRPSQFPPRARLL